MFLTKKLKILLVSKPKLWLLIFSLCLFSYSSLSYAQEASSEKQQDSLEDSLPAPPETGSPEDSFSAGGTRDNHQRMSFCGAKDQQVSFLLGAGSRETTVERYPSFWFYLPEDLEPLVQMEFVLRELDTNRELYRSQKTSAQKGIVGVKIPPNKGNALSPQMNYRWELLISCEKSTHALDGWINFVPMDSSLREELALVSQEEKFKIYWQENLIYDAVSNLAITRTETDSPSLENAWQQMLSDLGWQDQDLVDSEVPSLW